MSCVPGADIGAGIIALSIGGPKPWRQKSAIQG